jgi:hypothetical protein
VSKKHVQSEKVARRFRMSDLIIPVMILILLAIFLFEIIAFWKVFAKAGRGGWECLIPIWNTYVMLKIAGKPGWWLILLLIPLVNIVVGIMVLIDLAKAFGKGTGFALGLVFLGFIFYPILGYGDAKFVKPKS